MTIKVTARWRWKPSLKIPGTRARITTRGVTWRPTRHIRVRAPFPGTRRARNVACPTLCSVCGRVLTGRWAAGAVTVRPHKHRGRWCDGANLTGHHPLPPQP